MLHDSVTASSNPQNVRLDTKERQEELRGANAKYRVGYSFDVGGEKDFFVSAVS